MAMSQDTLRLCFIAPGSNVHTRRWVNAMAERGHEVLLIASDGARSVNARVFDPMEHIGPWSRVPKIRVYLAERAILRAVRRFQPHIVHMHWLTVHRSTLRLARRLDNLLISVWGSDVVWPHERPDPARLISLRRRILSKARHITATTHYLADETRRFLAPGREVTVIPFGVDCDRFNPSVANSAPGAPIVGFLKHYLPDYGPEYFIRAVPLIRQRVDNVRFEMYGTQPADEYRQLARLLNVHDAIEIRGPVDHDAVPATLRRFAVYVMPSSYRSETFGVTAIEASACGVPVVATRVGGVPEAVREGLTGLLVPPRDAGALADAVVTMLRDPALRARMAEAGPRFVLENFSWSDNVRQMEDLYLRLVVAAPARTRGTRLWTGEASR
jgi:glycosyltransferase involved in cell wall biosynthesis